MYNVLVADDEKVLLKILERELCYNGFSVMTAENGQESYDLIKKNKFDIILLDIKMPYKNGYELIEISRKSQRDCAIIMMTAFSSIESAVKSIKLGADDYLSKPFDTKELVDKIIQLKGKKKNRIQSTLLSEQHTSHNISHKNILMKRIFDTIEKIKNLNITVLITGENGTGKGVIAKRIHYSSNNANLPFMLIDCASLPENLIESELFGHEKGAFTGAIDTKKGKFELAGNGTVFLDEIGALPLKLQTKLLTVLQEKYFFRVGGVKRIPLKARIISATNENLEESINNGTFREDLYYRLNVVRIEIPPLRLRQEDIIPIANDILQRQEDSLGKNICSVEDGFFETLLNYNWPGNIRELENALECAMALCEGNTLRTTDLPLKVTKYNDYSKQLTDDNDSNTSFRQKEILNIITGLEKCGGHREKTAKLLGISRRTLQYKLKKYNLLNNGS